MTYRELMEFTKKNPNCFWNKAEHDRIAEYRYKCWVIEQNRKYDRSKESIED